MNLHDSPESELFDLLEAVCEDRASRDQFARLEALVLSDPRCRRTYLEYMELHGSLHWDAAATQTPPAVPSRRLPAAEAASTGAGRPARSRLGALGWTAVAVLVLGLAGLFSAWPRFGHQADPAGPIPDLADNRNVVGPAPGAHSAPQESPRAGPATLTPPRLAAADPRPAVAPLPGPVFAPDMPPTAAVGPPASTAAPSPLQPQGSSAETIVVWVDAHISDAWQAAEIQPSPPATDAEWIRRAYLDVVGHIPPVQAVEQFLADNRPDKRRALLETLLDDPDYVSHWTTIWTNLLIGRANAQEVSREALQRFLRRSFAENRPWSEIVAELIAAEGDWQQNGAVNFLLAHLNNEAAPATALTSRLFLGMNVQCTQCHDHPHNHWTQHRFWELNSFFQQTAVERRTRRDPATGRAVVEISLATRGVGGPMHFEDRRGVMSVAYPKFGGIAVDDGPEVNRRRVLAELMLADHDHQLAQAFVNRMWEHFFGYGFTRPVDDMGPHNPPSHPEVLERLAREFVSHGYDVKQLIRWICGSRPYQLSSRATPANAADDPAAGTAPLFSRMYLKTMSPEQLFDSLLIATRADFVAGSSWEAFVETRRRWLQQFVVAYQTDENDEATTFAGTVPQALMMMNGELTETALSARPGTFLHRVVTQPSDETERIRRLSLAALSRYPDPEELAAFRRLLRDQFRAATAAGTNPQDALIEGCRDLFWAFLNSSEFVLVH